MAITKTTTVDRMEVIARGSEWIVRVSYFDTFDDSEDSEPAVVAERQATLMSKTEVLDSDGNKSYIDTDITKQDSTVQSVCNLLWGR